MCNVKGQVLVGEMIRSKVVYTCRTSLRGTHIAYVGHFFWMNMHVSVQHTLQVIIHISKKMYIPVTLHIARHIMQLLYDPYAVFVFISIASLFLILLVPTSSYTVACELSLCEDSLDVLDM